MNLRQHNRLEGWDVCPARFSLVPRITLETRPLWLTLPGACLVSSLPRRRLEHLIKERKVKVARLSSQQGSVLRLIYLPSLWSYLEGLTDEAAR